MHSGDFDKHIKLFVCMLCVLILERSIYICGILVTGYCIFAPLVIDCLSVFNVISRVFCTMTVANAIQCVHIDTYNQ